VDGDNRVKLWADGKLVLDTATPGRAEISKKVRLTGQVVRIAIEYVHATGEPSLHLGWSGPGMARQILTPSKPE
jgi:hypothetical protein